MSVFAELAAHAALDFDEARMLPLAAYTDPAVLDAERAALFADGWICVGRTADLPEVGDHLVAEIPAGPGAAAPDAHRSIIVVRTADGTLAAHDNVCIHRGARLLDGCGNAARITCPYHAWAYRLDGTLIGAPYMNDPAERDRSAFRPDGLRLVPIRLEEWEGFVFATQRPDAEPLAPRLAGLTDVVAPFRMAGYVPVHRQVDVWATNWKLLVENFMDAYHVFKVHEATFGQDGDSTLDTHVHPGTDDWAHHVVLPTRGPDLLPTGDRRLDGDWRRAVVLAAVFPTHVMQLQPDWLWYLQISPLGTDRVRIRWDVSVAPTVLAAQDDRDAYVRDLLDLLNAVNAEDQPIIEGVRRSADGDQFPRGPLSYLERNVFDFDRYVARRLTR
ncbi:MAG: aromatic ring-hydroxylating dioxygenase subunit alpha [Planctomycetes bacterium]|nr:aromatic ring-hydroxylating dioxygenase subunit alpha [Planctomycetota bacterium]